MAGKGPKARIKKTLNALGYELRRFDPVGSFAKRRQRLLETERVGTVIDIGAHAGEYGQALRHGGYDGKIVSFEPLRSQHSKLEAAARSDGRWTCTQAAVGDRAGQTTIHISGNDGFSSSIRPMGTAHELADPSSAYVGSAVVDVITLDEAGARLDAEDRVMLKIDAQGYEAEILAGGERTLRRCSIVELELALTELYEGQALFVDLIDQMLDSGFALTDVESGFRDPRTSRLLQLDGLFVRSPVQ
jgi:FkbM family methyltransferase